MRRCIPSLPSSVASACLLLLASGCSTLLAVDQQKELAGAAAVLGGTVATAGYDARGPLVVGVVAKGADGFRLVDHFVAETPGPWVVTVQPGTYWIAAFEDANSNGRYDDEPAFRPEESQSITVGAGQHAPDLKVEIPLDGRFHQTGFSLADLQARGQAEQQTHSLYALSVAGKVTTLADPRFARDVASSGIWRPYDFLLHVDPGIYFLEPYDPSRIPVLFVHGMGGTPIDFRDLIARLDRTRYQAWIAYYPSGAGLDTIGRWLAQMFVRLRVEYRFEKAAVVAHSMGGIVSRAFLLDDFQRTGTKVVRTHITISSPLGGMPSAGKGVEDSPIVVKSWYGLAPGNPFLDGLFYSDVPARRVRRRLPGHIAYHLLFGYGKGGPGGSGDGTVPLSSVLRPEAQEEALSERGYDETHVGILSSPAVAARVNELLGQMR